MYMVSHTQWFEETLVSGQFIIHMAGTGMLTMMCLNSAETNLPLKSELF